MRIGTHNSAAYAINWNISFWSWNSKWEWLRVVAKWIPPIRNFVTKYVLTQSANIYEQLTYGLDVLDIRISYANGKYYTSHTFCCIPYTDVLAQIYAFIYIYKPAYQITVLLKPDTNNTTLSGREWHLLSMTTNWFSRYIAEQKIKIYYQPFNADIIHTNEVSDYSQINKLWFNVGTVSDFVSAYKNVDFTIHTGIDCVLTPQIPRNILSAFEVVFVNSIQNGAYSLNKIVILTLRVYAEQGLPQPAFCIFDYITKELVTEYLQINSAAITTNMATAARE